MKIISKRISLVAACIAAVASIATSPSLAEQSAPPPEKYQPTWSSLRQHQSPAWLDGMKLGIYFHWGANSVKNTQRDKEWGMLEAIDQWRGEKFDAKAWVDLMQAAGAQFGGPVAWHCNGILNWDSDITEWNSTNKGPKVDIFGELAKELRARDMKVLSSYHTCHVWQTMWGPVSKTNTRYLDPEGDYSALASANNGRISDEIYDAWFARISEAMDKYQPDIVWLDTGFGGTVTAHKKHGAVQGRLPLTASNQLEGIKQSYQQKLIAHYFNRAEQWGKEVELTYKTHDIPPGIGMRDIEDGNLRGLQYDPWIADIDMAYHIEYGGHWFYNKNNPMKDAGTLVDLLVDITSKNGRILLNVPPMADGSFSDSQVHELTELGNWLRVNGEAIYGTMPWVFYGEGPTEVKHEGHHAHNKREIPSYTSEDIRFTTKDDVLYAISMDWAGDILRIRTLGSQGKIYPDEIKSIKLLGSDAKLSWKRTPDALEIRLPKKNPGKYAYVFKVQM